MSFESGIVARLNAVTAVTTLTSDRIYANYLPDGVAHPAIVYQLISTVPLGSNLNADGPKFTSRVQFTLVCDSTASRVALSDAIKAALKRYQGQTDDITILDARLENIFDQGYDLSTDHTARLMDFLIDYE